MCCPVFFSIVQVNHYSFLQLDRALPKVKVAPLAIKSFPIQTQRSVSSDALVSKNDSKESKSYRQPWRGKKCNPKYHIISIPNTPGWCDAGGYLGRSCWTCQAFQSPWFMKWEEGEHWNNGLSMKQQDKRKKPMM